MFDRVAGRRWARRARIERERREWDTAGAERKHVEVRVVAEHWSVRGGWRGVLFPSRLRMCM